MITVWLIFFGVVIVLVVVIMSLFNKIRAGQVESYRIGYDYDLFNQPQSNLNSVSVSLMRLAEAEPDDQTEDWTCVVHFRPKRGRTASEQLALQTFDQFAIAALFARELNIIATRWLPLRVTLNDTVKVLGEDNTSAIVRIAMSKFHHKQPLTGWLYNVQMNECILEIFRLHPTSSTSEER